MPRIAVYLETGSKRAFACAVDWPGWCRSGKTDDLALEALEAYASRYARVAREAGVDFPKTIEFEVVGRREGDAGTEFGIPSKVSEADVADLTPKARERLATLVAAAWTVFDDVAAHAPEELRKGPRGGGRDRDKVVEHVLGADVSYAYQVGVDVRKNPPKAGDKRAVQALRDAVLDALRAPQDPTPTVPKRPWPRRYAARRIAWHALDHAWEIEDRSTPA